MSEIIGYIEQMLVVAWQYMCLQFLPGISFADFYIFSWVALILIALVSTFISDWLAGLDDYQ